MQSKEISVIVPIYRSEKYLKKCIDSLINQNFSRRYEIILVDFGYSEESKKMCDKYEKDYPSLFQVFHSEKNYGVSTSRNLGILKANGKYLTFVDSDDYVLNNYLSVLYNKACKGDYDIVSAGFYQKKFLKHLDYFRLHFTGSGKEALNIFFKKTIRFRAFCWGKLFKASLIKDNHILFPSDLEMYEDWVFTLSSYLFAKKIAFIRKPIYFYYQRNGSATHSNKDILAFNLIAIKKVKDFITIHDKEFSSYLFDKPRLPIKEHLLWDARVTHKQYNKSILKTYRDSKKELAKIYKGE